MGGKAWVSKFLLNFFFNVYLLLRDRGRQSTVGEGRERGRLRSRLPALSCQQGAGPGPNAGVQLTNREIMT